MTSKTSRANQNGLRAAGEISRERIASIVDVKIGEPVYRSIAKTQVSRESSSGQFVIRGTGKHGEARVIQKK